MSYKGFNRNNESYGTCDAYTDAHLILNTIYMDYMAYVISVDPDELAHL